MKQKPGNVSVKEEESSATDKKQKDSLHCYYTHLLERDEIIDWIRFLISLSCQVQIYSSTTFHTILFFALIRSVSCSGLKSKQQSEVGNLAENEVHVKNLFLVHLH